jgi:hypothetical protein
MYAVNIIIKTKEDKWAIKRVLGKASSKAIVNSTIKTA